MGAAPGEIWSNAGTTSTTLGWTLYVPNSVGTSTCPRLDGAVRGRPDAALRRGGSCSVTVTAAAPALGDVHRRDVHRDAEDADVNPRRRPS